MEQSSYERVVSNMLDAACDMTDEQRGRAPGLLLSLYGVSSETFAGAWAELSVADRDDLASHMLKTMSGT